MSIQPSKYQVGDLIAGRYKVIKLLGFGGMAEVYLTTDTELNNQKIALKLLHSHISLDQVNIDRFKREVEITQKHNHPNIVKSYHYGKTDRGEQYFTMEYVEGKSLADVIKEKGKIPYQDVYRYLVQILDGLSVAHKLGIIHRDIKPDNIMLTNDNVIKLSDFGIAKDIKTDIQLTDLDKAPKSYLYKAPELYMEAYDHRVDIYALGISTYEMLTGQTPFTGEKNYLLVAHLNKPIPKFIGKDSDIPEFFEHFVEICAEKTASKRFKDSEDALNFLKKHVGELSGFNRTSFGKFANRSFIFRRVRKFLGPLIGKYGLALFLGYLNFFLYAPIDLTTNFTMGEWLDLQILDRQFRIRGAVEPPDNIKIISVDEESYEVKKVSTLRPWPRELHAELLEKLALEKPKMVIFDYRFAKQDDPVIANPVTDQRLVNAMKNLPVFIAHFRNDEDPLSKTDKNNKDEWLKNDPLFESSVVGLFNGGIRGGSVIRYFYNAREPYPPIADVLFGSEVKNKELPSIYDLINFYGPPHTFKPVPYHIALSGSDEITPGYFKDKIVFIGQVLKLGYELGQRDTFMTPYGVPTAGVEIHATTAANILNRNWIRRMPLSTEASVILMLSILISYVFIRIKPKVVFYIICVCLVLWLGISYALFTNNLFFPGMFLIFPLMPLCYMIGILKSYIEDRKISKALGV